MGVSSESVTIHRESPSLETVAFPVETGELGRGHLVRMQLSALSFLQFRLVSVGVFAVLAEHLAGDRPGHHPVVVRSLLGSR